MLEFQEFKNPYFKHLKVLFCKPVNKENKQCSM